MRFVRVRLMSAAADGDMMVTAPVGKIADHSLIVAASNRGQSSGGILLLGNSSVRLTDAAVTAEKYSLKKGMNANIIRGVLE